MIRAKAVLLLALAVLCAACADTSVPVPEVAPERTDRYLIDPRSGYDAAVSPQLAARFETAWRFVLANNETEARKRLGEIRTKNPEYLPAQLAEAALDLRNDRYDAARTTIDLILAHSPDYLAARVYQAELAYRQHETRRAYDLYRDLARDPAAPATAAERASELQATLFNELYAAAQSAPDAEAVRLLREALTFNAGATEARILLGRKLVALRQFEEARAAIDPLLSTGDVDRAEIQEMLAEIDVGRGRYQEAIVRYDRLSRRTKEPRYAQRLDEIKEVWSAQNMPPQYRQAFESASLTRADFAVLLYWTVPSVRFAQNLAAPPIAVDIQEVTGREEMIRAIAIGLYEVDPVTRRVNPYRPMTAERLSRMTARLLVIRGAACARGVPSDRVLSSCGVTDPLTSATTPDAPVTGRTARAMLEQVAKVL
ncbi:MAG TPA: tetratricopeptide repeat protein [Thermoanaerobaculia bacterium]